MLRSKHQKNAKGDFMNSFDLMIEKYRRELIDAKRKSILQAIDEAAAVENSFDEETIEAEKEQKDEIQPVFAAVSSEDAAQQVQAEAVMPQNESSAQMSVPEASEKTETQEEQKSVPQEQPQEERKPIKPEKKSYGRLRVQVFAADQVYPISSAYVVVTESGSDKEMFRGHTDSTGIIENILLPAPEAVDSDMPSKVKPYSQYDITVTHPNFISRKYVGVPIFAGIESIQTVLLVPTARGSDNNAIIVESEPNELLLDGVARRGGANG